MRIATLAAAPPKTSERVVYYVRGVGSRYTIDRLLGGAMGNGLHVNIKDAYLFLAHNYRPGDAIYLFGFSRGAFTARCLAGMMNAIGLLKPDHVDQIGRAYRDYRQLLREDESPIEQSIVLHPPIAFMGMFDTVGSKGVPVHGLGGNLLFRDSILPGNVLCARHALAINDPRSAFEATVWTQAQDLDFDDDLLPVVSVPELRVEQVWFAGVHNDVGGGYSTHDLGKRGHLGYFSLNWMLDEAAKCGFVPSPEIRENFLRKLQPNKGPSQGSNPAQVYELHDPTTILYWLFDRGRHVARTVWRGDWHRYRRFIRDSAAVNQRVHESAWRMYRTDNGTLPEGEPRIDLELRHRKGLLDHKPRRFRFSHNKELRDFEKFLLGGDRPDDALDKPANGAERRIGPVAQSLSRLLLAVLAIAALAGAGYALVWLHNEIGPVSIKSPLEVLKSLFPWPWKVYLAGIGLVLAAYGAYSVHLRYFRMRS